MKIGVIDSGIGGISVLYELMKTIPYAQFVYFADDVNAPFGDKPLDKIRSFGMRDIGYLESLGCEIVVIACNTLTAAVKGICDNNIKAKLVGSEPAVKPALLSDGKIAVIATSVTARSARLKCLINGNKRIDVFAEDELVKILERVAPDFEKAENYIKTHLSYLNGYDSVVFGCTHFLFAEYYIKLIFQNIKCFDGNIGISRQTANISNESTQIITNETGKTLNPLFITASGRNENKLKYTLEYYKKVKEELKF